MEGKKWSSEVLGKHVVWTLSGGESHQSGGNCQENHQLVEGDRPEGDHTREWVHRK